MHVAGHAGDIERLAAIVALDDGDHFRGHAALVHQAADTQRALQAERDLRLHVGKLLLEELSLCQRTVELLAVEAILARGMPAEFSGTERTPGNAVAGAVEAAKRTLEAFHIRQQRLFADLDIVHDDFAGDRGAQRQLTGDLRSGKALHALFEHEAADSAAMSFRLRPDDEDIGERRVGNPHLRADKAVAALGLDGAGLHTGRIGAGVRLGQAEAADPLAADELREILLLLLFRAIGIDRIDHQRRLHAHHRAVAAVDALDFARDKAVGDVRSADAAIGIRDGHAEQAELAHLAEDLRIGRFFAIGVDDARLQPVLRIGPRRVADHTFVLGQLIFEQERIIPLKLRLAGHVSLPSDYSAHVIARGACRFKRN
ncbi:hypothetical protein D9M70_418590 [compost metagenome]